LKVVRFKIGRFNKKSRFFTFGTTTFLTSFFQGVDLSFLAMISLLGTFFSIRTLKTGLPGSGFFSTG
jgi:hypothetical protein